MNHSLGGPTSASFESRTSLSPQKSTSANYLDKELPGSDFKRQLDEVKNDTNKVDKNDASNKKESVVHHSEKQVNKEPIPAKENTVKSSDDDGGVDDKAVDVVEPPTDRSKHSGSRSLAASESVDIAVVEESLLGASSADALTNSDVLPASFLESQLSTANLNSAEEQVVASAAVPPLPLTEKLPQATAIVSQLALADKPVGSNGLEGQLANLSALLDKKAGAQLESKTDFILSHSSSDHASGVNPAVLQESSSLSDAIATVNQGNKINGVNSPSGVSLAPTVTQQAQISEAVAEKVMWMSSKGLKEASIQLDPPELGHLTVKVSVSQEQASVSFTVQNPSVKEALDQSVARLREMFAEDGLNLADVDVSDQSSQEQQSEDEGQGGSGSNTALNSSGDESQVITETIVRSRQDSYSLVDSYV